MTSHSVQGYVSDFTLFTGDDTPVDTVVADLSERKHYQGRVFDYAFLVPDFLEAWRTEELARGDKEAFKELELGNSRLKAWVQWAPTKEQERAWRKLLVALA